jgi:FkbM family methyltransferase
VFIHKGIYLPDGDTHFAAHLDKNPMLDGHGTYQYAKCMMAIEACSRKRTVIDIGAHVGLWSLVLSRHFETVHAFEPSRRNYECLLANTDALPNVLPFPYAIGDNDGYVAFTEARENSGNTRVWSSNDVDQSDTHLVKCSTIDVQFALSRNIDLIKIDVEGFELPVLLGGKETIMRERPVVVIEQKPGNAERYGIPQFEALDLLKAWGGTVVSEKSGDYIVRMG